MDDKTIKNLSIALMASPENVTLRLLLAQAHLDSGNTSEALNLVRSLSLENINNDLDHSFLIAQIYFAASDWAQVIEFAPAKAPEGMLMRAKAMFSLGREQEARETYKEVVRDHPTVEDEGFAAQLFSTTSTPTNDGKGPKLRLISGGEKDETTFEDLMVPEEKPITFADVGGLNDVKKTIHRKIIQPYRKPSLFKIYKKKAGGGVLLYGPPGCGKTLLARATAGECGAKFLNVALSDVLDMYIGESERKLKALFDLAREHTPSVLFFDEIEGLGSRRQHNHSATAANVVSQFLSEMDGFAQDNAGVLILGATNIPWAVDSAFRRPGRFDRVVFVAPPDREARNEILRLHMEGRPGYENIEFEMIAEKTSGFSGADLENLIEAAANEAIDISLETDDVLPIDTNLLLNTLKDVRATTTEWLSSARNYARYSNEGGLYDEVLTFLEKHGSGR